MIKKITKVTLASVLAIVAYKIRIKPIQGSSMESTLHNDDLIIWKTERNGEYNRGDIVILKHQEKENTRYFIKRIANIPGEPLILGRTAVFLPKDHYWVLGDNADVSYDSRSFGPVKKSEIKGRYLFRIYCPH